MLIVEKFRAEPGLMNVAKVAAILEVHPNTIYKWKRKKKISFVMVGDQVRFDPGEMVRWYSKRSVSV